MEFRRVLFRSGYYLCLGALQVVGVNHNQRTAGMHLRGGPESAGEAAIHKAGVHGPIVLEGPAEDVVVEAFRRGDVGGWEFDVVDAAVVGGVAHETLHRHRSEE